METMITTEQPTSTPDPADELEALRRQLQAAHERIAVLCARSGPEYLTPTDVDLASWLAGAAAAHPQLHDPTAPMAWPAAARAQLEELISKYHGGETTSDELPRAEQLRIAAAIHELCEANDCGLESTAAEIADAIVFDDDRAWRRLHMPEVH